MTKKRHGSTVTWTKLLELGHTDAWTLHNRRIGFTLSILWCETLGDMECSVIGTFGFMELSVTWDLAGT